MPLVEHTRTGQGVDGVPWLTDVWSLCPLLPQTGSFKSGRQVSAVGPSTSPGVTPASDVCQLLLPCKTLKDLQALRWPDTWWPPDLQNVSQGRCGREAGRGQPWAGRCRHPDGASGAQLHPTPHCTALFLKHDFALPCSAQQCILVSQCRTPNLCCAAVCQWKCTSASVEPDLKVTPPKCFFINRPVWTPPAPFVPRTAGRHFVQHSRLCPAVCAQAAAAARSMGWETLDFGLEEEQWQKPGLNKISHSLESVVGSMAELAAWSGSRRPPVSCL